MSRQPHPHTCMSHVARIMSNEPCHRCKWVMSHMWMSRITHVNGSCHTYAWVIAHVRKPCHTCEWVISHICQRYVDKARTEMSQHTHQRVMSHMCTNHGTHINESCHAHQSVISHTSTRYVTHINESCHTHQRVMSHTSTSHVTHINESCHTHQRVMSHTSTRPCNVHMCVTWVSNGHIWRSRSHVRAAYTRVMSHAWITHATHRNESCHTYEGVAANPCSVLRVLQSHVWRHRGKSMQLRVCAHITLCIHIHIYIYTYIYEYAYMYTCIHVCIHVYMNMQARVCAPIIVCTSHATHTNTACHKYECVTSRTWIESYYTHGWVMSHIRMSQNTRRTR